MSSALPWEFKNENVQLHWFNVPLEFKNEYAQLHSSIYCAEDNKVSGHETIYKFLHRQIILIIYL